MNMHKYGGENILQLGKLLKSYWILNTVWINNFSEPGQKCHFRVGIRNNYYDIFYSQNFLLTESDKNYKFSSSKNVVLIDS